MKQSTVYALQTIKRVCIDSNGMEPVAGTPKRQFVGILWSRNIEYLLYKPPYLTG